MSPTVATFLFEAANFLVLAGVLSWLFFKPIRKAIDDYRMKFEADNHKAAEKLAEAEQTQRTIESAHMKLQDELNELRSSETKAAREQAEKFIADARSAATHELQQARQQASSMSNLQRDRLAEVSATAASQAVGRLLNQITGPDLQTALVASACKELSGLRGSELGAVRIESTRPVSEEQLALIHEALGAAAGSAEIRTVDDLGDGIRISTNQGLIDATVKGLVQFASHSLVSEMHRLSNKNGHSQKASSNA